MTDTRTACLPKLPPIVRLSGSRNPVVLELQELSAAREAAVAPYRAKIARCEEAVIARLRAAGMDEERIMLHGEGYLRRDAACKRAWDAYYDVWMVFGERMDPLMAREAERGRKVSATKLLQRKTRHYDGRGLEAVAG